MITKKNYIPTVCTVFTLLVLGKLLLEKVMHQQDQYYTENIFLCFFISLCATFILSMHRFLVNIPLLFVMIGQYILVIGIAFLVIFLGSFFTPVSPGGYCDIFWSVTIPYIVLAIVYYISYFHQVKQANELLNELKMDYEEQTNRGGNQKR